MDRIIRFNPYFIIYYIENNEKNRFRNGSSNGAGRTKKGPSGGPDTKFGMQSDHVWVR